MFREWGYLLGEIWFLLALAALLGLLAGWLIWGGRKSVANSEEADLLRADLDRCRKADADKEGELAQLRAQVNELEASASLGGASAEAELADLRARLSASESARADAESALKAGAAATAAAPAAAFAAAPAAAPAAAAAPVDADGDGFLDVGSRPKALKEARGGVADDLKRISGIGPKLEKLCNRLGFFHFDQLAAWSAEEIAWVDANLEGFKGRVTRDDWVGQAKLLAQGITPKK